MLFLVLFACGEQNVVTYVGGGSATVTLSQLEGSSDLSFDVPGLSEDQLDEAFSDGHKPYEVYNRLIELSTNGEWAGAMLVLDENGGGWAEVAVNGLSGFEPCGLPLSSAYVRVLLTEPFENVSISDGETDLGVHNTATLPDEGVHDWDVDDYSGSSSVDVDVTCPSGVMTGLLQLEWALDPDVSRDAHERIKQDSCMFCG